MTAFNRRGLLAGVALSALGGGAAARTAGASTTVTALKADGVDRPMGLDAAPRLSWQIASDRPGVRQTAYQIGVASSEQAVRAGHFDIWDSGRVSSAQTFDIPYGGPALKSGQTAWWHVRIWDDGGKPSPFSTPSNWEMGLLDASDWKAAWIEAEDDAVHAERAEGIHWIWGAEATHSETRKFRWRFSVDADCPNAVLRLSAKDQLRGLWLDGQPMPRELLAQSWAKGPEFPMALKPGPHVLAVEVGLRLDEARPIIGGALAAQLRLSGTNGQTRHLVSGPEWRTILDAPDRWQEPAFDDANWTAAQPAQITPPCTPWPYAPPVRLRREFRADKPVVRARLRATALGAYVMSLNGQRVGDALLTPEATDYTVRTLYRTYDVTKMVTAGASVLGASVGDGWFGSPFSFLEGRYSFGPPPRRLLAQLELTYADGSSQIVATDASWTLGPSPILRSELYDGESFDARRIDSGWDAPGFDAAKWTPVRIGAAPGYSPTAQVSPPIRVTQTIAPVRVTPSENGYIYDFGQNFTGWCRLRVTGPAGSKVTLRFAEAVTPQGQLDTTSNRRAAATDTYILRGDTAGEVWEPAFTYHGFRYVEVSGLPCPATTDVLTGLVIHSDTGFTGRITTTDRTIENLWRNTLWSQRSNFTGMPTDCPQRDERMAWTGDAEIFWDAAAFNMDVDAFTRRYAADLRAGQLPDGRAADIAPYWIRGQNTPGWSDALVVLPWTVWQRYGDTTIISENWQAMARFNSHLEAINPDFIWRNQRGLDYGDWLSVDAKSRSDITTPKELVSTAMWARSTRMMAEMAKASGRDGEARRLGALYDRIVAAFRREFVHGDGVIGNDSQTSHILALSFGLLPEAVKPVSTARLAADIRRRNIRLSTGFMGTPFILDALADNGEEALAVDLLLQTEAPSWGAMVNSGATTMWERWDGVKDGKVQGSLNHYAFGAVNGFVYRRLGGIDCAAPGFRRMSVRPILSPRLDGFGAEYLSVSGRIATNWKRTRGQIVYELTVPPNTTADLSLPGDGWKTAGGKPVAGPQIVGPGVHRLTRA